MIESLHILVLDYLENKIINKQHINMKNENLFIYYGILFLFLYLKVYLIISNLITSLILSLSGNIFIVPIILSLLILGLLVGFYKLKSFPKINLWVILIIIALLPIGNSIFLPSAYYEGGNSLYNEEERKMIASFITYCSTINYLGIIIISYLKYYRYNKKSNVSD